MNISSIGFKLTAIIVLIVLVSLSAVTAIELWLMQNDFLLSAQMENFESNRRFADEAQKTFSQTRSVAALLAQMISSSGTRGGSSEDVINLFFDQNPRIAALYFSPGELILNERFFLSRAVDSSLVHIFMNDQRSSLALADLGGTFVLNAAPHFAINLLAVFFPGRTGAQMALFSPDDLISSFGFGIHQNFILNGSGDILIHEDYELVRSGFNAADYEFVRAIMESPSIYRQSLVEADFGVFGKSKVNNFSSSVSLFFGKVKNGTVLALSKTGQFIKSAYNKCADAVFKLLKKERKAPRRIIAVENHGAAEEEMPASASKHNTRQYIAFTKTADPDCIVITGVDHDKILKDNSGVFKRFLFLAGGVLCFSVILIWFFVRSIFLQQEVLADVANQIEPVSGAFRTRDLLVILLCVIGIIAFFSLFRLSLPRTAGLFEDQIESADVINIDIAENSVPAFNEEEEMPVVEAEMDVELAAENRQEETDVWHEPVFQEIAFHQSLAAMPETGILTALHVVPVSLPPLPAPENMIPRQGYRIDINNLRNFKNIRFSWAEVPEANAYIYSLYLQTVSGRRLITRTTVEYRTVWTLENMNVLSKGTFIWQVEPIVRGRGGAIDRRGKTAENAFIIE